MQQSRALCPVSSASRQALAITCEPAVWCAAPGAAAGVDDHVREDPSRRTLLTAALATAGALALAAPVAAAPPPPPSTYQGAPLEEGYSRSERYDDHGVYLHSIGKGNQYFSYTDDSMLSEGDGYSYYGTRASTFYLNTGCTADGSVKLRKAGKGAFFKRIDSTSDEVFFTAEYDAAKDSGTFTLVTAAPGAYDQERDRPDVCTP